MNDGGTGGTEDSRRGGQRATAADRYAAVPCDRRKALCAHIGGTTPLVWSIEAEVASLKRLRINSWLSKQPPGVWVVALFF